MPCQSTKVAKDQVGNLKARRAPVVLLYQVSVIILSFLMSVYRGGQITGQIGIDKQTCINL